MQKPNVPHPLHRLLWASLVGLVAGGLLAGVVGLAAADGEAVDAAQAREHVPFGVAAPHLGDRASYVVASGASEQPLHDFEWRSERILRDNDGKLHPAHELLYTRYGMSSNGANAPINESIYFDAVTHEPLAVKHDHSYVDSHTFPVAQLPYSTATMEQYILSLHNQSRPFCGLFSNLQGQRVDLQANFTLRIGRCDYIQYGAADPTVLRPLGRQPYGDIEAFVFQSPDREMPNATYWFTGDIPYPVQIRLNGYSEDGDVLIRLARFHRGATALDVPTLPAGDAAPASLAYAARTPTGMDETGISHPFPLSAAFSYARDDPTNATLRDFLATHPQAYMAFAIFHERHEGQSVGRQWTFMMSDGVAQHRTSLVQTVQPSLPLPPAYSYSTYTGWSGVLFPTPDNVPSEMPTVSSIWNRWRTYATDAFATKTPNHWSFLISCGHERHGNGCQETHYQFSAGYSWFGSGQPSGYFGEEHFSHYGASAMLDHRPWYFQLYERDWAVQPAAPGPGAAIPPPDRTPPKDLAPQSAGPVSAFDVPWKLTPEAAAGAGAFALAVAAFYFSWPYLKALAVVGLFSRVEKPKALEQPRRDELMQLIEHNPGIHFMELVRRTGLGHGNVQHHVATLVRLGLVSEAQGPRFKCYYAKGSVDRRVQAAVPYLKPDGARHLLELVRQNPGLGVNELARRAQISAPTAHYHVKRLEGAGLVVVDRHSRRVAVRASDLSSLALAHAAPAESPAS